MNIKISSEFKILLKFGYLIVLLKNLIKNENNTQLIRLTIIKFNFELFFVWS